MKTKRVNIKGHAPLPTNLEEAFDMVEWDFLIYLMRTMGFGAKWRAWNKECVSTATYSILINGSPKCFFSTHRGLHMGESSIFIPIYHRWRSSQSDALKSRKLQSDRGPSVSHLQYANDTLLFCNTNDDQVKNMVAILTCFEVVSGLNINLSKSALLGISVDNTCLHHFADILGCKVNSFPSSYLALPLCLNRVPNSVWNPVVEKIEKKLPN